MDVQPSTDGARPDPRAPTPCATPQGSDDAPVCPACEVPYPPDYRICPRDGHALHGSEPPSDPLVGTVLAGTYRLSSPLARGGMGHLYEAAHLRLERRYAVKVIHSHLAGRDGSVARFEREARAAGRLRSAHVVDVADVLRTADGRPCIVTSLLEGEDLCSRLEREGRIPASEAIAIARQMCHGLAAAHAHGVVHRDLKPSNLFLASDPHGGTTVKLLDFGVAKLGGEPDITRTGAVVGTPAYMPPEQARGAARIDARADVYGVGAVLYHMVTGRPPYTAADGTTVLSHVLQRRPPPPAEIADDVPVALEAVIEEAMARDADERVPNVSALERKLASVASDVPAAERDGASGADLATQNENQGTLLLPAGSVSAATSLARRARRARPLAVAALAGLASGAALTTASVLASAVRVLGHGETASLGERLLLGVAAITAAVAVSVAGARALRARWRSAVAVGPVARRLSRALLAGTATLGALALVAHGGTALGLWNALPDVGLAWRMLVAAATTLLATLYAPPSANT